MTSAGATGEPAGTTIQQMHYNAKMHYHNTCRRISHPSLLLCRIHTGCKASTYITLTAILKKGELQSESPFYRTGGIMTIHSYADIDFSWNGISMRHYPKQWYVTRRLLQVWVILRCLVYDLLLILIKMMLNWIIFDRLDYGWLLKIQHRHHRINYILKVILKCNSISQYYCSL